MRKRGKFRLERLRCHLSLPSSPFPPCLFLAKKRGKGKVERTDFSFSSYRPVPSILTVQLSPFPLAPIYPYSISPVYSEKEKGGNSFLNFLGNMILPLASLHSLYGASVSECQDQEFEFTNKANLPKIEHIPLARFDESWCLIVISSATGFPSSLRKRRRRWLMGGEIEWRGKGGGESRKYISPLPPCRMEGGREFLMGNLFPGESGTHFPFPNLFSISIIRWWLRSILI